MVKGKSSMTEKNTSVQIDNCLKTVSEIALLLVQKGKTVSLAESITGGLIAKTFTDVPGSSKWFSSGIVSYSDEVKNNVLGVEKQVLQEYSAVSKECAVQMALGANKLFKSDFSIAVTGYAGPEGESVGKVFIAVSGNSNYEIKQFMYNGSLGRIKIRQNVMSDALIMFYEYLKRTV